MNYVGSAITLIPRMPALVSCNAAGRFGLGTEESTNLRISARSQGSVRKAGGHRGGTLAVSLAQRFVRPDEVVVEQQHRDRAGVLEDVLGVRVG